VGHDVGRQLEEGRRIMILTILAAVVVFIVTYVVVYVLGAIASALLAVVLGAGGGAEGRVRAYEALTSLVHLAALIMAAASALHVLGVIQ
jgi:hypothetical protein